MGNIIPYFSYSLNQLIQSIYGVYKKCIILDLDNTLWGGIIGDDGIENINIGFTSAKGEAYLAFQQYLAELKKQGILLAVCSKNNLDIAKSAFLHDEMVLKFDDFISFKANWSDKAENIKNIIQELNIGEDSIIFIDDSSHECERIKKAFPEISVIQVDNIFKIINKINKGMFFNIQNYSEEDSKRSELYQQNKTRLFDAKNFTDHNSFLKSLNMEAIITKFTEQSLKRVTQLINKTNQFNLTGKKYTQYELENLMTDSNHICFCGKLIDKFGDNGIVTALICSLSKENNELHIKDWVMSCRVFQRSMEYAMFNYLLEYAKNNQIKVIFGEYKKTNKNIIIEKLYEKLGFEILSEDTEKTKWRLILSDNIKPTTCYIKLIS